VFVRLLWPRHRCCVAQADTVNVLLERLIPELEDLRTLGIFTEVSVRRTRVSAATTSL
jgi:hypothetical protein